MNTQLLTFLKENHSIDGTIKVDSTSDMLDETVERINEHQSADVDIMVNQLIESELIETLARALVERNNLTAVCAMMDLENLAESNLTELINDLLRADDE